MIKRILKKVLVPLFVLVFFTSCKTLDFFYYALDGKDLVTISALGLDPGFESGAGESITGLGTDGGIDLHSLDKVELKGFSIGDYNHPLVRKHLSRYQKYGKQTLKAILERGSSYTPMIRRVFEEHGIPEDLIYLPIIESGFNPYAHSHAGAKGLWQFIYTTGVLYKLKASYWHDDRQDVYRSTVAAAYHLRYLYKRLGDWLLVLAAYNAGAGKISRAISRYETKNFWELIKYDYIKPETKNYVPKFIAATILAKNSEKYQINYEKRPAPELASHVVEDATELKLLARAAGISLREFKIYNAALTQWATPPSKKYPVYVPVDRLEVFLENLAKIPKSERITFRRYFVRVGDNLTKIASKFSIPITPIAEINRFRSINDIYAGKNIIIPIRGLKNAKEIDSRRNTPGSRLTAQLSKKATKDGNSGLEKSNYYTFIYILAEKETLYDVAVKFKVDLTQLMDWNNLASPLSLRKNQELIINKPI